jgi:dihydropteroate synthase
VSAIETPTIPAPTHPEPHVALALPRGGRIALAPGRPLLVGVVNVTPDSFSDGGRYLDPDRAVAHALELAAEGADLLDLGAESTRPGGGVYGEGAREVPEAEELARLMPVLERLRPLTALPLSVDTRKAGVARAALAAGGDLVNDVSGLGDPAMAGAVAEAGCPIVLMHSRGELATMQRGIRFGDVVAEVRDELAMLADRAARAGVGRERIVLDPGLGFGKRGEQNRELLRRLSEIATLGYPLFVGASRKSFLGEISGTGPDDRLPESLAAAAAAARGGAAFLRVHDVAATRRFLSAMSALAESGAGG